MIRSWFRNVILRMDWTVENLVAKEPIEGSAVIQIRDSKSQEEVGAGDRLCGLGDLQGEELRVTTLLLVQSYKTMKPGTGGKLQTGNSPGHKEVPVSVPATRS